MSLAAKLKKLRMQSRRSLQQLADEVGVSKAHIYELESGNVKNHSVELLKKLAKVFSVPVAYFINDDEDMEVQIMFRNLQKNFQELPLRDREAIETMVEALKNKRKEEEAS